MNEWAEVLAAGDEEVATTSAASMPRLRILHEERSIYLPCLQPPTQELSANPKSQQSKILHHQRLTISLQITKQSEIIHQPFDNCDLCRDYGPMGYGREEPKWRVRMSRTSEASIFFSLGWVGNSG